MLHRNLLALIEPLKKIISPLHDYFGVTKFSYSRNYTNNSSFILTTETDDWNIAISRESIYAQNGFTLGDDLASFIICDYESNTKCMRDYNMMMLIKELNYTEKFCFGTTANNHTINYYYQYRDLFYRFRFYFLDKADKLIAIAKRHKIHSLLIDTSCKTPLAHLPEQKTYLQQAMPINKVYIYNTRGNTIYITKKEMQCIYWIMDGKSSAEIAVILNISLTTINTHIKNVKTKVGLYKISQLVKFFCQYNLLFFDYGLEH